MITKDEIMRALSAHSVKFSEPECSDTEYNRVINIKAFDSEVKIEWWSNIAYMFIGEMQVPFHELDVNSNWPNRFVNISLRSRGVTTAIIPVRLK